MIGSITDRDMLFKVVCYNLEDWDTKRILADWYEENGWHHEANCWRWIADNHKRPYEGYEGTESSWHWYDVDRKDSSGVDPESDIPTQLFNALKSGLIYKEAERRDFNNVAEAYNALVAAWIEVGGVKV